MTRTYEAHLFIDGGNGPICPVRVIGYIEEKAFVLEEVWIEDVVVERNAGGWKRRDLNIIENLSDACIKRLQDEANKQAGSGWRVMTEPPTLWVFAKQFWIDREARLWAAAAIFFLALAVYTSSL